MDNGVRQSILSKLTRSPLVKLSLGIIGAGATYLQYMQAGFTLLFWILCGLTVLAALASAIPFAREWLLKRKQRLAMERLYYNHQERVRTLVVLIEEFTTIEKAKSLAGLMKSNARAVAILPVEGKLGVILNVGKEENLQEGTQLLVHRIDRYTSDGQHIEEPLALVKVTYVQAENNCSQAVIVDQSDIEFWEQAKQRLKREKSIDPPRNFAAPYIPQELDALSLENLRSFREYLELIRDSLTHSQQ